MSPRQLGWFGAVGLSFLLTTCTENPSGPAGARRAYLALRPEFSTGLSLASFGIGIDSLRVIVVRPATDTLYDATVPFPADSSALNLQAAVNLSQPVETLLVALEFRGGGVALFTGTQSVEVQSGAPGTNPPATVAVSYTGPGNAVDSLSVTPVDSVIRFLDSLRFRVAAFQAGLPVTQFYVAWTTSDTAAVKINGIGLVRAPAARRSVYVIARTPNGVRDSVPVTLIPVPTTLAIVSGDAQSGPPSSPLALPLRVRVTALDGLGVKGIPVTFTPLAGGGSVSVATVVTDTGGYAQTNATLGASVGGNAFQASATGLTAVSFSAAVVAGVATQLVFTTQPVAVTAGAALPTVIVTARDAQGFTATGFAGTVTMALGANPGGATLTGTTSAIATTGTATFANLHLDKAAAGYTLVATSGSLTPDTSAAFGVAAAAASTIALVSGNAQPGFIGVALGAPLVVKVTDAFSNPVSGTTVTWTAGAGTITPSAPTTDAAGLASASWTLGGGLGAQTAQAAAAGLTGSPIAFSTIAAPVGTTKTWTGAVSTDWTIAGNWNPTGTPAPSDNVFVPSAPANQPILTASVSITNLVLQTGASLGTAGFNVLAAGDVDASGSITGVGVLGLTGTGTISGTVPNLVVSATRSMSGNVTATGSVTVGAADFLPNAHTLVVSGPLTAQPGRLVMTNANDSVDVTGLATFQSDNGTSGTLSAGTLILRGGFQQRQAGTGQTATFAATGAHKTVFAGAAHQSPSFQNPGPSAFRDVEFANGSGVTFNSDLEIDGAAVITAGTVDGDAIGVIKGSLADAAGGRWQVISTTVDGTITLPDSLVTDLSIGTGSLAKRVTNLGNVQITGDLTMNGQLLRVRGNLTVQPGRLLMTATADTVDVTGFATFQSDNGTTGTLSAGTLLLRNGFQQLQAGTGQTGTFTATGTHKTVFAGTSPQGIDFQNSGSSVFRDVEFANGSGVAFTSTVEIDGAAVITSGTVSGVVTGVIKGSLADAAGGRWQVSNTSADGTISLPDSLVTNLFLGTGTLAKRVATVGNAQVTGDLTMNGKSLRVSGTLLVQPGRLLMTNAADTVDAGGLATFQSDNGTAGTLTGGTLILRGGFQQLQAGTGQTATFSATGAHRTVFAGTGTQTVTFANPGSSFFHHLDFAAGDTIALSTAIPVQGALSSPGTATPLILGSGQALSVVGLDVDGLILDNVTLSSVNGNLTRFDNVTYQNTDPTAVQLTISHPGGTGAFQFTNVRFLTTPTSGKYVSAVDNTADANVLTINMVGSQPADGSPLTLVAGGALVNWAVVSFTQNPTGVAAGSAIAPAVTVTVRDALGNVNTSYTDTVTIALGANPGGATLTGNFQKVAVAGVATFDSLFLDKAAAGYALQATARGVGTVFSTGFAVVPGAISTAKSLVTASSPTVGIGLLDTLTLQARDAFDNVIATGGATVVFTQSGTGVGTISGTADHSDGTYTATFTGVTIGPVTIGATIGGSPVTTAGPTLNVFTVSTTHAADITTNETWTAAQSPHIVTGYLRVRNGATLTIDPNAVVKFDPGTGLQVGDTVLGESGALILDGTAGQITLTANTATPAVGFWKGLEVQRSLAVPPWKNVLIEWGGGARTNPFNEACVLTVNGSGAPLTIDSVRIRQCVHAAIHHFGGQLHVRASEIDSVTGSGIHADFNAVLELDTTVIRGSGQEGLFFGSPLGRLLPSAGNSFFGNATYGIDIFAAQLPGLGRQSAIAGNGNDSIRVGPGRADTAVAAFTIYRQPAPYIVSGLVQVGRSGSGGATLTLDSGLVMTFDPTAGLQVGDTSGTQFGQLRSGGTASSPVLLTEHLATPWRGVGLGLSAGPDTVRHVHIVGGGGSGGVFKPANAANLTIFQPSGSAPFFVDSIVSDQSAAAGIVVGRVGVVAPLHRIVRSTITNTAGHGLVIATTGTQPSVLDSLNTFSGIGGFPLVLTGHALAGHSAQASIDTSGPGSNDILITTGQTFITNVQLPVQIPYMIPDSILLIQGGGGTFTLEPNLVMKFGHASGLVIGDSAAGPAGDIVSLGTGPSDAPLLTSTFGTGPGEWLGLEIGRLAATRRLANVQVQFAGDSLPGRSVRRSGIWVRNPPVAGTALSLDSVRVAVNGKIGSEANSAGIVVSGAGTGVDIRRSTVDSNAGFGVAYDLAGVRLVGNTISANFFGVGLFSPPAGLTAADSVAGNLLTLNGFPMSLDIRALPGIHQNFIGPNVRDTLLLRGGRFAANDTLPNVPGTRWRVLGTIEVDSGGALTIAADTVSLDSLSGFIVGDSTPGGLRIVGTAAVPIVLTATPTGSPFDRWFGIQYDNVAPGGAGPFTEIRNAVIERAGLLVSCGIIDCQPIPFGAIRYFNVSGVTLPVDSVTFRHNFSYSVDAKPKGIAGGTVAIVNSQFYNTAAPLIAGPLVSGSNSANAVNVHNSDLYGYKNDVILGVYQGPLGSDTIDASNNWWGDALGPSVGFSFNDPFGRASVDGYAVQVNSYATTPFFPVSAPAAMVGVPDSIFPGDTVGRTLPDSVRIRVVDLEGRGVAGQPVSWTPYAGGNGNFPSFSGSTDNGGRAGALWTLGTVAHTNVANVLSASVSANIYADGFPDATIPTSVHWQLLPSLTLGAVSVDSQIATYTSSFRSSALVTNARDQYGNVTQPTFGPIFDQGPCSNFQCTFPAADSTHGDTVFFRPPAIGFYVITGQYDFGLGGSGQVTLDVTGVPAGVKIDRDVFTPGIQDTGTVTFNSLCRNGAPVNFYCSRQFDAVVVDSGGAPFGGVNAAFYWTAPAFPDTSITLDSTRFAPSDSEAFVTAHQDGTTWLVVQDTSGNNYGRDSLPIVVQQVPLYISVKALAPDTIVIGDTTRFAGAAVDQGGDTIQGFQVHWRVDPPYTGTLTILDTATVNQVVVQLDSTLFGQAAVTAFGCCGVAGPLDSLYGSGTVFNPVTFTAPAPPSPTSIVADPGNDRAYVASPNASQITVIDGPTHSSVDTIQVNYNPNGLALNSKTGRLYVSETFGGPVWVIDAATNTPIDSFTLNGGNLSGEGLVAVDTAANRIYVPAASFINSPYLYILDGATNTVLDSVAMPELGHGVAVNPNDGMVYVTLPNVDSVAVVDPVAKTIVTKIAVGDSPFGVAINGTTNMVYVSNQNDGTLSIIDGATRTFQQSLTIGSTLQGLSVDPVRNEIYVSDLGNFYVYVVDGLTVGIANYLYIGATSADAAVDPVTRTVYASQFSNGQVTIIRYKK